MPTKCYYSLIQFCPDRRRAECVNIGLVLMKPELRRIIKVRLTKDFSRVRCLFGTGDDGISRISFSAESMKNRLLNTGEIITVTDLEKFAATRANDLQLTPPRMAKIEDFDSDFERLFKDLVLPPEREVDCSVNQQAERDFAPLLNTPVLFGLEAQGHIPTIEIGLSHGDTWQEIGSRIGWEPETAKRHYEMWKERAVKSMNEGRANEQEANSQAQGSQQED